MRRHSGSSEIGLHKGLRPRQLGLPVNVHSARQSASRRWRRLGNRWTVRRGPNDPLRRYCRDMRSVLLLAAPTARPRELVFLYDGLCPTAQLPTVHRLHELHSTNDWVLTMQADAQYESTIGTRDVRLPGFTAEVSVQRGRPYGAVAARDDAIYAINPASYVDQNCLAGCEADCGKECAGTAGQARSACIKACARDNSDCRSTCTRAGNPPVSGGGGSGPATRCDPTVAAVCSVPASTCLSVCPWQVLATGVSWCSCLSSCVRALSPPFVGDCFGCVRGAIGC